MNYIKTIIEYKLIKNYTVLYIDNLLNNTDIFINYIIRSIIEINY